MGLKDHASLNRGDYYKYITDGEEPLVTSYTEKELQDNSLTELREIAKNQGIDQAYKYKKSEIIEKILENQIELDKDDGNDNRKKLLKMNLAKLREIADSLDIKKSYKFNKNQLIDEILNIQDIDLMMDEMDKKEDILEDHSSDKEEINIEDLSDNATEIIEDMDSINYVGGILDLHQDGYGFLRIHNYQPSEGDIYVSPSQIRKFRLRNGDEVTGVVRPSKANESYNALIYIKSVNGLDPSLSINRPHFEKLIPIYPKQKLILENTSNDTAMRLIDLISPIGKGQRGMIVSQPKSGKTTLLKKIAKSISTNYPEVKLMVVLIDERPEEVTDMIRSVDGEVVYSTFDEQAKNHIRVAENAIERAKRLVENKYDVVILLDSLTRLARAYNLVTPPSGKTLSGGLDPLSLHKPKRFFGAARNIEEGGSLTILATTLIETGSRMDDIIFEEFKGTGNMEVHLDRKLSERRIFPAIDIYKSGTRKEEYLLDKDELNFAWAVRRAMNQESSHEVTETLLDNINKYKTNREFIKAMKDKFNKYES
ncbi:transcription termination factor Rho [Peptoniphilus obesi]|uniref:transcription termination factor Rho n=1 Tax=Peptoniphilus obesi TaxID=1472765 RepID=UPI0009D95211